MTTLRNNGDGFAGFDPDMRRLIQPIWDYLAVSDPPDVADVIFVFGSRDFAVPPSSGGALPCGTCLARPGVGT